MQLDYLEIQGSGVERRKDSPIAIVIALGHARCCQNLSTKSCQGLSLIRSVKLSRRPPNKMQTAPKFKTSPDVSQLPYGKLLSLSDCPKIRSGSLLPVLKRDCKDSLVRLEGVPLKRWSSTLEGSHQRECWLPRPWQRQDIPQLV